MTKDDLKTRINDILDGHASHTLGQPGFTRTEALQAIVDAITGYVGADVEQISGKYLRNRIDL